MCSHIPNRGEQMVRYYGYYSNVSRGKRKEAGTDDAIPCLLEPEGNVKAFRKSWARLIQKIYEVDPLSIILHPTKRKFLSILEPKEIVDFKELLMSDVIQSEAIINLLDKT